MKEGARLRDGLTGRRFGRLIAVRFVRYQSSTSYWETVCDCGVSKIISRVSLRKGLSRSCGCLRREGATVRATRHGLAKSPEYSAWASMIKRCANINDSRYSDYGGRGITVCERWVANFAMFYADMGPRPSNKHSLDRIDVNGNYEPGNVRWATVEQQLNNKRTSVYVAHGGRTQTVAQWARELNVKPDLLRRRLRKYGSIEAAV